MRKLFLSPPLFLSPSGRIPRRSFIIGVAGLAIFIVLQLFVWRYVGMNLVSFFFALALFFLNFHIIMAVYGKRLHDLGRSFWPLIGLFSLIIIVWIIMALNYGGVEYFDTVMAHPEYAGNEEEMKKVLEAYQDKLAVGMPKARWVMAILPTLFTLWLVLAPGQEGDNRYGDNPVPAK
ncbi:MAG: hypothetical protein COB56_06520 [Robiginitomaculum sp.]|nr:MAG: hypothetical protein COB56_06520 [Robiginitomaculum sp.]